jgi:hypothetical protein
MPRLSRKIIACLFLSGPVALAPIAPKAMETLDVHKEKAQIGGAAHQASGPANADTRERVPDGTGHGIVAPPWAPKAVSGTTSSNGITYHGGPVMLGTTNIYYIWYGSWWNNSAPSLLTKFASSIGGSLYFNINTTYFDGSGTSVSNSARYAGSTNDIYSQGRTLTNAGVQQVVTTAITSGRLPRDPHGVYFVLTSSDVAESSGFCTQYCGWHTHANIVGADIKFAFVGNADRCPSACAAQSKSPNGNPGADAMASVIAHELEETVTDPHLDAWYDSNGNENADKCAWTFGNTTPAMNGSVYNMVVGGNQYLIQRNWVNASGGYCAGSF